MLFAIKPRRCNRHQTFGRLLKRRLLGEARQQRSMLMRLNPASGYPKRVRSDLKRVAEMVLKGFSSTFSRTYSGNGRASIPLERLLKASLLMAPCTSQGAAVVEATSLEPAIPFLDLELYESSFSESRPTLCASSPRTRTKPNQIIAAAWPLGGLSRRPETLKADQHYTDQP
jgi:hypothetical protein